jgi:hypothetical protein
MSARSRTLTALAAGALILTPLAGCGSDAKSAANSTSPTAPVVATSGTSVDKATFIAGIEAAMKPKKSVHLTLSAGPARELQGDMSLGGSSPLMRVVSSFGGGQQHIILANNKMYMQQSAGGKYVTIGKDDPTYGSLLGTVSGFSPESVVAAIGKGATRVGKVGPETIDGVQLTRYAVTVDPAKVTGGISALIGVGGKPYEMQFLVDSDNLLHQIRLQLNGRTATLALSGWGQPVSIAAPPASQLLN